MTGEQNKIVRLELPLDAEQVAALMRLQQLLGCKTLEETIHKMLASEGVFLPRIPILDKDPPPTKS